MAKDFGKANSSNKFKEVAKANEEKANIIQVKMISTDNLIDYPNNNEDLTQTADLENSMKENGFTDPIEVTSFNMEDGKYMIVSGHRRRVAGVKVGYGTFPCIIKNFKNELEIRNYVLSSNAQRNAVADPLLFCKRYKMHEEYLKESQFKGSMREEIAKRLGISTQQADRYNKFNNVILPVWDMVKDEIVGISSVIPMASHSIEEQEEILIMLKECLEQGQELTRDICSKIIKGYREGKRSYIEILQIEIDEFPKAAIIDRTFENNSDTLNRDKGVSVISVNPEPSETKKNENSSVLDRNNEIEYQGYEKEFEPKEINNQIHSDKEKKEVSEEEKKREEGENLNKLLYKLDGVLHNYYSFSDKAVANEMVKTMHKMSKTFFEEMESISEEYKLDDNEFKEAIKDLIKTLETYL